MFTAVMNYGYILSELWSKKWTKYILSDAALGFLKLFYLRIHNIQWLLMVLPISSVYLVKVCCSAMYSSFSRNYCSGADHIKKIVIGFDENLYEQWKKRAKVTIATTSTEDRS